MTSLSDRYAIAATLGVRNDSIDTHSQGNSQDLRNNSAVFAPITPGL